MPNVVNDKYNYQRTRFLDAEGNIRHSAGNGDAVARAMLRLSPDQIADIAEAHDVDMSKYKNPGLAKMALSSRLRALVRKDTQVQIGDCLIKKLDQKQPELKAPKVERKAAKTEPTKPASKRTKRNGGTEETREEATE